SLSHYPKPLSELSRRRGTGALQLLQAPENRYRRSSTGAPGPLCPDAAGNSPHSGETAFTAPLNNFLLFTYPEVQRRLPPLQDYRASLRLPHATPGSVAT